MSEDNAPITITLKGGSDFSAPWLVIRGNRPEEVANMLSNLGNLPEVIAQQASLFAGTVSAGPVLQQQAPPQQEAPPAQPAWGTVAPQGFQPAQQGQAWQSGQQAPPQQAAPPPGITQNCTQCGQQLIPATTRTGKSQFKCPQYRWDSQSKSGNGHTLEWVN